MWNYVFFVVACFRLKLEILNKIHIVQHDNTGQLHRCNNIVKKGLIFSYNQVKLGQVCFCQYSIYHIPVSVHVIFTIYLFLSMVYLQYICFCQWYSYNISVSVNVLFTIYLFLSMSYLQYTCFCTCYIYNISVPVNGLFTIYLFLSMV